MMMRVLRVFTPSPRSMNTRLLTYVPVVEPFLQVLHDVLAVRRKLHNVGVAMHLQILDDLPALLVRPFRSNHAVLRRAAGLPWNISAAELMTYVGISRNAGVEQKASLGQRSRAQSQVHGIEVARSDPELLVAGIGGAQQLINRGDRTVVQE